MKSLKLLPYGYKKVGWLLFVPGLVLGLLALTVNDQLLGLRLSVPALLADGIGSPSRLLTIARPEITFTLAGTLVIVGGLLLAFSREKFEDEYVAQLRLASLQWAVLVNYSLLLLAFLTVYGTGFLMVLPFNMFTALVLFVARFEYTLYKNKKWAEHEEHA